MQATVLVMILSVTLCTFLTQHGFPGLVKFVPELLTAYVAIYVIAVGARQRFRYVAAKYWIAFGAILVTIICGIFTDNVEAGPVIAGMRSYLRAIPFFFLPALFDFTEKQLRQQIKLLLAICLLQLPIAVYQRWEVMSAGHFTGDGVTGTVQYSGPLSMFVISAAFVLLGLFMRQEVSKRWCIILFFILLLPTTINETKVTIFILPIGLFATLMMGAPRGKRISIIAGAFSLLLAFGAIFVPIYNKMQENNPYPHKIGLILLTDPKQNYMVAKHAGVGATDYVGRLDSITVPLNFLARDPIKLAFGIGIGNASKSSLGEQFTGKYFDLFEFVAYTTFSTFLLELGLIGTAIVFLLYWLILNDAIALARIDNRIHGGIAIGWVGVVSLISITTFYVSALPMELVSYLFWYFSGLVAARRMRLSVHGLEKLNDRLALSVSMPPTNRSRTLARN